jgi:phosphoserine phosphatase
MRWPPYRHVFFDCDSTLTTVEGIDALAEIAGKGWRVSVLTGAAMNGQVELEDVYDLRLRALKPTHGQVYSLRQVYKHHAVPDAAETIAALQALGHEVYIISGGLAEPVEEFGLFLGVPRDHIRAVAIEYNELSGRWWHSDEERPNAGERYLATEGRPLTVSDGKARIVRELLADQRGRSLLVGDGVTDLLAGTAVDLFAGYGGVVSRPRVRREGAVFLSQPSLAPVLALAAGPSCFQRLSGTPHQPTAEKAMALVGQGAITFRDEHTRAKFHQAYQAVHSRPV